MVSGQELSYIGIWFSGFLLLVVFILHIKLNYFKGKKNETSNL